MTERGSGLSDPSGTPYKTAAPVKGRDWDVRAPRNMSSIAF